MNTEITQKMLLAKIHITQQSLKDFINNPIEDNQLYLTTLKKAFPSHYDSLERDIMLYNTMKSNKIKSLIPFSYGLVTDYKDNNFVFTPDKIMKDLITRFGDKVVKMTELYPGKEDPPYYMKCVIKSYSSIKITPKKVSPRMKIIKYDNQCVPSPNDHGFDLFIIKERE